MNSYQKLKQKYTNDTAKLYHSISVLINNPDSFEAMQIAVNFKLSEELSNSIMFGNKNIDCNGLLDQITLKKVKP